MYHDASEVLTGDLPTPVKYFNSQIAQEYKAIEKIAQQKLIEMVPEELRDVFEPLIDEHQYTEEEKSLVKQADALCAYLKCLEELSAGITNFTGQNASEKTLESRRSERWIILCRCLCRASIYRWMRSAGFSVVISPVAASPYPANVSALTLKRNNTGISTTHTSITSMVNGTPIFTKSLKR